MNESKKFVFSASCVQHKLIMLVEQEKAADCPSRHFCNVMSAFFRLSAGYCPFHMHAVLLPFVLLGLWRVHTTINTVFDPPASCECVHNFTVSSMMKQHVFSALDSAKVPKETSSGCVRAVPSEPTSGAVLHCSSPVLVSRLYPQPFPVAY